MIEEIVVKIQRSITTNAPIPQVLIYNQDRSLFQQFDLTPELQDLFRKDEFKVYYRAFFYNGELTIKEKVRARDW